MAEGRQDNVVRSEEEKTPLADAKGETAKGAMILEMAEGTQENASSQEHPPQSEQADGEGDKGAVSDLAEGTQDDNTKGMQDNVDSEDMKTPSKEANGESGGKGSVSDNDVAEEMQDNAYSEEPPQPLEDAYGETYKGAVSAEGTQDYAMGESVLTIHNSPIGETLCQLFLEMKRKIVLNLDKE